MRDLKISVTEFDKVLKQALARTYSENPTFSSEAGFKYELFHRLYGLKVGGHKLGVRVPGYQTCMLHVEANAVNGLRGQSRRADLVLSDPTDRDEFNYRVKAVVELKKSLNSIELDSELEKFKGYGNKIPKLYVVSANPSRIDRETAMRVASRYGSPKTRIDVLDPATILKNQDTDGIRRSKSKAASSVVERVTGCIKITLELYGRNSRDPYHSFFWRNYEHENEKGWTFPCEGDFTAQLYHRLRSRLSECVVTPEYQPPSASPSRVDLFVGGEDESVGIEVKMNYDNFKGKDENAETSKLSKKFKSMSRDHDNHVNILVVIQGQDAHKGSNKTDTLHKLRRGRANFGLMYYDEHESKAMGPLKLR